MNKLLPSILVLCLALATSCKDSEGIVIDFQDPQEIPTIGTVMSEASSLIDHFGEAHLVFGHTPPNLDGISFGVDGLDYEYSERYRFNQENPSLEDQIPINTAPPVYDASRYYHRFYDQVECISNHRMKTEDAHGNKYIRENDDAYVIGHDSLFTVYYIEKITDAGSGNPTNAILISGTVRYDAEGNFLGISNYRYGKQILRYDEIPENLTYAKGTIEIKTHHELCPALDWDNNKNHKHLPR